MAIYRAPSKNTDYLDSDIFPNTCSTEIHPLQYPSEKKFVEFQNHPQLKVFIPHLSGKDILLFHKFELKHKYLVDIKNVAKGATAFNHLQFKPAFSTQHVKTRLQRPIENKENCDVRMAYKVGPMCLVKTYFTFGQRTVKPDTVHFYQTLDVPLHLMIKKSYVRLCTMLDGFYPELEMKCYTQTIIPPNTRLRIPSGITYFILSPQKIYFSVDILPSNMPIPLDFLDLTPENIVAFQNFFPAPTPLPISEEKPAEDSENEEPPSDLNPPVEPLPVYYIVQNTIPLDRAVQVVSPDFIQQYHALKYHKLEEAPPEILYQTLPHDPERSYLDYGQCLSLQEINR